MSARNLQDVSKCGGHAYLFCYTKNNGEWAYIHIISRKFAYVFFNLLLIICETSSKNYDI